ncbi:MAG: hypothetical protein ACPGN7_04850 [Nitrosopumilus sp.]
MAIDSAKEYVDFFINLNMGNEVSLLSFANNEKMVLKQKLKNKINQKEPIEKAISSLEIIIKEISEKGEAEVLAKYQELDEKDNG